MFSFSWKLCTYIAHLNIHRGTSTTVSRLSCMLNCRTSLAFRLMPRAGATIDCTAVAETGHLVPEGYGPIPVQTFLDTVAATEQTLVVNGSDSNIVRCFSHLLFLCFAWNFFICMNCTQQTIECLCSMVRQGCVLVRNSEKCDFYNVQIVSVSSCSVHGWYSCSTPGASLHKCRDVTTKCSIWPTHVRNNKPSVKWVSCLLDYLHSMTSWKSGSLLDYLLLSILIAYIFLNLHSSPLPSSTDITLTVFSFLFLFSMIFLCNLYILNIFA